MLTPNPHHPADSTPSGDRPITQGLEREREVINDGTGRMIQSWSPFRALYLPLTLGLIGVVTLIAVLGSVTDREARAMTERDGDFGGPVAVDTSQGYVTPEEPGPKLPEPRDIIAELPPTTVLNAEGEPVQLPREDQPVILALTSPAFSHSLPDLRALSKLETAELKAEMLVISFGQADLELLREAGIRSDVLVDERGEGLFEPLGVFQTTLIVLGSDGEIAATIAPRDSDVVARLNTTVELLLEQADGPMSE